MGGERLNGKVRQTGCRAWKFLFPAGRAGRMVHSERLRPCRRVGPLFWGQCPRARPHVTWTVRAGPGQAQSEAVSEGRTPNVLGSPRAARYRIRPQARWAASWRWTVSSESS